MKFRVVYNGCGYFYPQYKLKWYSKWRYIVTTEHPNFNVPVYKAFTKQESYDIISEYNFKHNIEPFIKTL